MPLERAAVPSSKRTLSPRIVAPPRIGKDGVPLTHRPRSAARPTIVGSTFPAPPPTKQFCATDTASTTTTSLKSQRASQLRAAPHPQRLSVNNEGDFIKEPTKKTVAVPDHIQSRVHDEQEYLRKREQILSQGREETREELGKMHAEELLGVECTVDNADSWAGQMMARFLERFGRMIKKLDSQEDPILRADITVQILQDLGESMKSYRSVFMALAAEVQLMVTKYESHNKEVKELRQVMGQRKKEHEAELLLVEHNWKTKFQKLEEYIEDRKGDQKRLDDEIFRARQERQEAAKERKALAKQEAENMSHRRQNEAMASQFAIKNKTLEEKIPVLERELTQTKSRAEQLQQINSRYARRISQLEHETAVAMKESKESMVSIQDALERTQAENKEIHVQLQALKVLKHRIEKELKQTQEGAEKEHQAHETELRSLTPRPTFRENHHGFFGSLTSTANRVDAIADQLDIVTANFEEACQTNKTLASALFISKNVMDSYKSIPQRSTFAEIAAVTQSHVANGGVVPQFLSTTEDRVKCRVMLLRDTIYKMRELFDLQVSMASRTTKGVCMSMVLLSSVTDAVRTAQAKNGMLTKPNVPLVVKGNDVGNVFEFVPPLAATETCYSLYYAAQFWSSHPVVDLFSCVLREEVGAWMWQEQNKFVASVMAKLVQMGECELQYHLQTLETELTNAGFSTSFVLAAQQQFQQIYSSQLQRHQQQQPSLGGFGLASQSSFRSGSFRHRTSSMRAPAAPALTISDHATVKVDFDPAKNNPALATAIIELPMMSMLRSLFLDRQTYFNVEYDKALATKAVTVNGRKVVSQALAITALLRVCQVDQGLAEEFVSAVFSASQLQSRSEASFIRNPPEMLPGGSSSSNLFMPGFTASYFGTLRRYPTLRPFSEWQEETSAPTEATTHLQPKPISIAGGGNKGQQRSANKNAARKDGTPAMTPMQMALTPTVAEIQLGRGTGTTTHQVPAIPPIFNLEGDTPPQGGSRTSQSPSIALPRLSLDGPAGDATAIIEEHPSTSRAVSAANSPHTPALTNIDPTPTVTPAAPSLVTSRRNTGTALSGLGGSGERSSAATKPTGPLIPLILYQRMFRKQLFIPTQFTLENHGAPRSFDRRRSSTSGDGIGVGGPLHIPGIELN